MLARSLLATSPPPSRRCPWTSATDSSARRRRYTSALIAWSAGWSSAARAHSASWQARRRSPAVGDLDAPARRGRRRRRPGPRPRRRRTASAGRLEPGGVAVVPAPVEAPDVADHELGLVVGGAEVGQVGESVGDPHGVDDLVERGAGVHHAPPWRATRPSRAGRCRRARRRCGRAPAIGRPWAGQEQLGLEGDHPAQRDRPVGGVALHLLGVAGVGEHPDEQVAGRRSPGGRAPTPRRGRRSRPGRGGARSAVSAASRRCSVREGVVRVARTRWGRPASPPNWRWLITAL